MPPATGVGRFGPFQQLTWQYVCCWRGRVEKKIPPKCRDLFRSCANTVGHAAATGDESSIKALKVMARVILHKIRGGKKKVTAVILRRLEK
jgi:hypothetical protein